MSHCHQQLVLNLLELQKERITRKITHAKVHFAKIWLKEHKLKFIQLVKITKYWDEIHLHKGLSYFM